MFINIFGSRSKSPDSAQSSRAVYPRKRSVGQKGVRFNTSRVVFYTHSKKDYDRGGMSFVGDVLDIKENSRTDGPRPPVLDSDDEDSLDLDLSRQHRKRRSRSSIRLI